MCLFYRLPQTLVQAVKSGGEMEDCCIVIDSIVYPVFSLPHS